MNNDYLKNNSLVLSGKIVSEVEFCYEKYSEKFYEFNLLVEQYESVLKDDNIIPVVISEKILKNIHIDINDEVSIKGQYRSYNSYENERNKLVLYAFVKEIELIKLENSSDIINEIKLYGRICKKPIFTVTPFGRKIGDLLLAVEREKYHSDFIPIKVWGRYARACKDYGIGTEISVTGRINSLSYNNTNSDGSKEKVVYYEVSAESINVEKLVPNDNDIVFSEVIRKELNRNKKKKEEEKESK